MCQTLLFIPHEFWGIPVFGVGWLLLIWGVFCISWIGWVVTRPGGQGEVKELIPFLFVTGLAIVFVLPRLEVAAPNGEVLGLPIRGYGTLMLLGVIAGWGLATKRGLQRGVSVDLMASLAWRLFIFGVIGARLFYVIEYWPDFQSTSWAQTIWKVVTFTEGGLVVYGSLIGGFLAFVWFVRQHSLSMLAVGDIIAPGVILGMAIGRIGCLMNGCCYGGECDQGWSIQFPRFSSIEQRVHSPPYRHQLALGRFHGFQFAANAQGQPIVQSVDRGGPADRSGLTAGVRVAEINGVPTPTLEAAENVMLHSGPAISLGLADGQRLTWNIDRMPDHSRGVHPSQIYGAISGFLICFVLLSLEPFVTRRGVIMVSLLTLYPPLRFLEEMIRDDEPAQWGTALTISQLISIGVFCAALLTWWYILRSPSTLRRSAFKSGAA